MVSSANYYIDLLNNIIIYIYRYGVPVIYVLGNIGNLLSAMVFSKKSWRKHVCVFYFNVCLLVNSVAINAYIFRFIFATGFNIDVRNSSELLCKLSYYVGFLVTTLLPTVLILATIDRLLISSQNVDTRLYSSKRLAYFSISLGTAFWVVFNIHLLIKVHIQPVVPSTFECFYDLSSSYLEFVSYCSLIITLLFSITMIILLVITFKNVHRIRAVPHQQRHQVRTMTKKDFQLLRCLFIQDVVYIPCNIFLNVYYAYVVATMNQTQTSLEEAISNFFKGFLYFLQFIPFCASFFIFVIVSKAFRHELKRLVYKTVGKDLIPLREEDNQQPNIATDNIGLNVVANNIVLTA
jgi:hypothetical protein